MNMPRMLGKMTTYVEKIYRPVGSRMPGFYQEVIMHFVKFLNEDGSVRSLKLDREEPKDFWREPRVGERSSYGEVDYLFPGADKKTRLICIKK